MSAKTNEAFSRVKIVALRKADAVSLFILARAFSGDLSSAPLTKDAAVA